MYVIVPWKTDHFVIISDFEIIITPCNGEVRIAIAYTIVE